MRAPCRHTSREQAMQCPSYPLGHGWDEFTPEDECKDSAFQSLVEQKIVAPRVDDLSDYALDQAILRFLYPEEQINDMQLSLDIPSSGGPARTAIRCHDLEKRGLIYLAYEAAAMVDIVDHIRYWRLTVRGRMMCNGISRDVSNLLLAEKRRSVTMPPIGPPQTTGGAVLITCDGNAPGSQFKVYKIWPNSTVTVTPLRGGEDARDVLDTSVRADALSAADGIFTGYGDS